MASDTEIANLALDKIGEKDIASLDADTPTGRLMKRVFPQMRDRVLRSHHWNFATVRTALPANTTTPAFGFDYTYPLPVGDEFCLKVIEVDGEDQYANTWKVEGRAILTDKSGPLKIRYIKRDTDYGNWDPLAVDALASLLAAEIAPKVGVSDGDRAELVQIYREKIAEARAVDGQEGMPDMIPAFEWLDVRTS